MTYQVRVWDLPTRIFHWSLVLCILGLVVTGQIGGNAMTWHFRFGYTMITLLLFRVVWGFVGGNWSRFSSFIYSPATIFHYLLGKGKPEHSVGHNPVGAGSVFALLFFLLAQVGSGLISDDEIMNSGPLTRFVSNAWVSLATYYHKDVGKFILIALVILHVAAILFYLLRKKENLIKPMVWGDKITKAVFPDSKDDARSRVLALALLMVCAALVYGMLRFSGA
jgi:cytochrome b